MNSRKMVTRIAPALAVGAIAALVGMHRAEAQQALPSPTGVGPVVKGGSGIGPAQPSAPGLPGAGRSPGIVNKGPISADLLSPNDELFDAIDRGDVTAARDAIARGAELSATNAVGQTPIDESVALGRNDITFLLVTLLHSSGSQITDAQGPMNMPPPNTLGLSSKDVKAASTPISFFGAPAPSAANSRSRSRYASAESPAEATQLPGSAPTGAYSAGAPVPAAGFVGFGSSGQ